jgi:hypothetical protein
MKVDNDPEGWHVFNEDVKACKQKKAKRNSFELKYCCKILNINYTEFSTNAFKLTKKNKPTINYYPKTSKIYLFKEKEWIQVFDITKFLKNLYL